MEADAESQARASAPAKLSYFRALVDQAAVTQDVLNHKYIGDGTAESPFQVEFIENDTRDPMKFSSSRKWLITLVQAGATLSVSFGSSAFSGGIGSLVEDMGVSTEVAILTVSLYVLGFAIGPLLWAPLSEMYGRQWLFFGTYMAMTAFNAGAAGASSITGVIVLRFFAGSFGSSPLTNAGGVIADMFTASERGFAMCIFALAPFLGPAIGMYYFLLSVP
jgi:MFS family permease